MKKRFLSLVMALVMCLGLIGSAGATGDFMVSDGKLTKYTGVGGDVVIPNSVKTIGFWAFKDCSSVTSITIPDSVTSINSGAFVNCTGLTSIIIPASVETIGYTMFAGCSNLTAIKVDPANSKFADVDGVLYHKDLKTLDEYPAGKGGVYRVLDGVTLIDESAFRGARALTGVVIPGSVTNIAKCAFENCTALTSLTIVDGVTEIEAKAFGGCTSLTDIVLPKSITTLGNCPFEGCVSLTKIEIDPANSNYASLDGVLYSKDLKKLVAYPGGGDSAYIIPDTVTSIGNYAFDGCTNLNVLTIPGSLTYIGSSPFSGCNGLTRILVDSSNPKYADINGVLYTKDFRTLIAFPGSKDSIYSIPEGVTSIENFAFARCDKIESLIMPSGMTQIGEFAFDGCANLTSISIPDTITNIGRYAFQSCSNLVSVYYSGTESDWNCIELGYGSTPLETAEIHYNSSLPNDIPAVPVLSPDFEDVNSNNYFAAPVAWAVEKEITTGTSATTFSPAQDCTNAQILTFLWRACGKPAPTTDNPFTNTISEAYQQAAVWAYEQGMVTGTTFDTSVPCTRAMAVTYIWQACGSPEPETAASFTDVPAGADYAQAVAWAVEQGVTTGTSDTTFSPDAVCNRGQIVTFLHRAMG